METQNKINETLKGPYYVVPKNPLWDDDLWYHEVFDPRYTLNKLKSDNEKGKEKK